jgi:Mn-dependent DtxR family transcriptional regulator
MSRTAPDAHTKWNQFATLAQPLFKRAGLSAEEAREEAESFAWAAQWVLQERLDEKAS